MWKEILILHDFYLNRHLSSLTLTFESKVIYQQSETIDDIYTPYSISVENMKIIILTFTFGPKGHTLYPTVFLSSIVRPTNRDWACQTERCHTLSNKTSLQ